MCSNRTVVGNEELIKQIVLTSHILEVSSVFLPESQISSSFDFGWTTYPVNRL